MSSRSLRGCNEAGQAERNPSRNFAISPVRARSLRDAILHSAGANATHGLRRANADKRRAVAILLEDPLVSVDPHTGLPWSDREVARRCSVDHKFVAKIRAPLTGDIPSEVRAYPDRYGNVTQMRTGAIGRKPVEAPAVPIRQMVLSSSLRSLDGRHPHASLHDSPPGACRPYLHSGCRSGAPTAHACISAAANWSCRSGARGRAERQRDPGPEQEGRRLTQQGLGRQDEEDDGRRLRRLLNGFRATATQQLVSAVRAAAGDFLPIIRLR